MVDEYALRREAAEGREATAALSLVSTHMEAIRSAAVDEIINSRPEHKELRERMIVTCQIVDAVRSALEKSVVMGDAATHRLVLAETVGLRR